MTERFFAPELFNAPTVRLDGSEAHHLLHVLRLSVGDVVELFDGEGGSAAAEIITTAKSSVELTIRRRCEVTESSTREIDVATAIPKSDRFRWMVEKATELGVRRLLPLRTARSVVHPRDGKLEKMRQTVIAACKQSGRNRLMQIESLVDWKRLIAEEFEGKSVIVAHPGGLPLSSLLTAIDATRPLLLVVGPEGGLTNEEVEGSKAAGAALANLGVSILRIETAVLALAAVCTNLQDVDDC